jgi:alkylhydroperoxidase/carboxymuconolactone decarboxylase family protein YurZ
MINEEVCDMASTDVFASLADRAAETWSRIMPGLQSGGSRARQADGGETNAYPLELCSQIVFGHVWNRPELSIRDRRILTIAVIASSAGEGPAHTHVRAALNSGDLTPAQLNEFVTHFAFYAGMPRASGLNRVVQEEIAAWRQENGTS